MLPEGELRINTDPSQSTAVDTYLNKLHPRKRKKKLTLLKKRKKLYILYILSRFVKYFVNKVKK
jgi:hypothetical protein